MHYSIKKTMTALGVAILLIGNPSWAETPYADSRSTKESSTGAIAFDALVVRPVGVLATMAGTAVFIVSLPFGLLTDSTEEAAQKLIGEPARYTFVRPLGENLEPPSLD